MTDTSNPVNHTTTTRRADTLRGVAIDMTARVVDRCRAADQVEALVGARPAPPGEALFAVDLWADLVIVHDARASGLMIDFDGDPSDLRAVSRALRGAGFEPRYVGGGEIRARRARR